MLPGVKEEQETQPVIEKAAVKKLRFSIGEAWPLRLTWRALLYHPLTWLAVGAHIGLLVVPFNPDNPAAVEPEEPEEAIDASIPVDILNLSALSAPEPPPDAPNPGPVTPPPAPTAALPPPTAAPVPAAEPAPAALEPAAPPETEPATPPPPPPPAYSPGGDQNAFTGNLGNLGLNTFPYLPELSSFPNENGDKFLDFTDKDNPVPRSDSLGAQWTDKQPDNVLGLMQDAYAGSGLLFTEWTPYEGDVVYQLSNPDGNPFMYVSVVNTNGSSLLVMWPDDPSLLSHGQ